MKNYRFEAFKFSLGINTSTGSVIIYAAVAGLDIEEQLWQPPAHPEGSCPPPGRTIVQPSRCNIICALAIEALARARWSF